MCIVPLARMNGRPAVALAPKTAHYTRGTLTTALNQALKWGVVTRNVAALVGLRPSGWCPGSHNTNPAASVRACPIDLAQSSCRTGEGAE